MDCTDIVLGKISELVEERRRLKRAPDGILYASLNNSLPSVPNDALRNALNDLYYSGKIKVRPAINGTLIEIT